MSTFYPLISRRRPGLRCKRINIRGFIQESALPKPTSLAPVQLFGASTSTREVNMTSSSIAEPSAFGCQRRVPAIRDVTGRQFR